MPGKGNIEIVNIRQRSAWGLAVQSTWGIPLVLSCLGILVISAVTSQLTITQGRPPFIFGVRQLKWLLTGLAAMVVCTLPPIGFWQKRSGFIWFGALILMVLTLLPGIGRFGGGASRWVRLGPLSVQASEVMLMAFAIHLSSKLTEPNIDLKKAIAKTVVLFVFSAWPFLFQPDLGGAVILFALSMGIFVQVFGWKIPILTGAIASVALFTPVVFMSKYRLDRITTFLDPWKDPLGSGFQTLQGFVAFANGGFWGVGIGHGLQKLQYLPAAHTDFILAVIGEELGLVGTFSLVFLFGLFFVVQFFSYISLPWGFGATLVWALVLSIFIPFLVNAGGVLRLLPLTGVPLPFISYGGSSLVFNWCKIGILLRLMRKIN